MKQAQRTVLSIDEPISAENRSELKSDSFDKDAISNILIAIGV